jgi:hypothetical protein
MAGAAVLALVAALASPAAPERPRTPGLGVSPEESFRIAFEDVCLRATFGGAPVAEVARARRLVGVSPREAGAGPQDKAWRIGLRTAVYVAAWADGSCSTSVTKGDPQAFAAAALRMAEASGRIFHPGLSQPLPGDAGTRTAYCTGETRPFVLVLTTRSGAARRPALVTTTFRARGDRPEFCNALLQEPAR